MHRYRFPIIPYLEQLPYWVAGGLDKWLDRGSLMPLGLATLIVYIFVVARR